MNLLILGGTTEASALARALAGDRRFRVTLSLAGRTRSPLPQPLPCRSGGFGGAEGLARYLAEHRISALVDATHPFAAQMTRNAIEAARRIGTKLLVINRPAWQPISGDRWTGVPNMEAAAAALGREPNRVLLTIGQQDLAPFAAAPWHSYVIRSVEPPPPESLPLQAQVIAARGPFLEAGEHSLLLEHRIGVLVTKNSGGEATRPKLAAARALGLPVVMVARPELPQGADAVATAGEAMAWLTRHHWAAPRGE